MKLSIVKSPDHSPQRGTSLIEAVIAVGVLAVAVPLVFGTMVGTGETGMASQAETRCSWIVPVCMEELQLAMKDQSEMLDKLEPGVAFPSGNPLALGFTGEGKAVKRVSTGDYTKGVRMMNNEPIRYIASMSGELPQPTGNSDLQPNLKVKIVLEYPAAAPEAKRQKIEFYTTLP
jgi:Tfp pilus assembly protein PilV